MVEGPLRWTVEPPLELCVPRDRKAFMPSMGLGLPFCDHLKEIIQFFYQEPATWTLPLNLPFCRVLIDGNKYAVNVIEGFNCGLILYLCSFVVYSRAIIIFTHNFREALQFSFKCSLQLVCKCHCLKA